MENTNETKRPKGRPSIYSENLARDICKKVATTTNGLRRMCAENPGFPNPDTIREWRHEYRDFSAQYDQAKRQQADLLAEDILDIVDDEGLVTTEDISKAKLRSDRRMWIAARLLPKVYGDKVFSETNVTFNHEQALQELKLKKND